MEVDGLIPDTEPLIMDILLVGLTSVTAYRSCIIREAGRFGVIIATVAVAVPVVDISSNSAARRLLLSARCRPTGDDVSSPTSDAPIRDRATPVPEPSSNRALLTGEATDSVPCRVG